MPDKAQEKTFENILQEITLELENNALENVSRLLLDLHPGEVAHVLESLPRDSRNIAWKLVDPEIDGEILVYVNDEVRASLISDMKPEELVAATEGMDMDDLADIIQDLPDDVTQEVITSMDQLDRSRLEAVLAYPEDSAGGLMNPEALTIRADVTIDTVLRYLRIKGNIPDHTDNLIVVDRYNHYQGMLSLSTLLTSDPSYTVAAVMDVESEAIQAMLPEEEVAKLFENRDLVSAAVVDEDNRLLGRITVDDVVDVIRDQAEHNMLGMAGLGEEDDMFAPVVISTRNRAIWLGVNLLTVFLAAWVIGLFEATLEKVVALAILMPIAASMGGIAGTQTLTLVIRGMAVGQITKSNLKWLFNKELLVGALNGVLWSVVVASVTILWFHDWKIGVFIGAALIINMICAAVAGFSIPLFMKKMGIDPVLAGSVALTTVTDVIGYVAFLGLATLFLL